MSGVIENGGVSDVVVGGTRIEADAVGLSRVEVGLVSVVEVVEVVEVSVVDVADGVVMVVGIVVAVDVGTVRIGASRVGCRSTDPCDVRTTA